MTDFEQKLREGLKKITGGENAEWTASGPDLYRGVHLMGTSEVICAFEDGEESLNDNPHDATLIAAAPVLARFFLSVHTYEVHVMQLEDRWVAWNMFWRLSARGFEKDEAVNFIVGSIYAAMAHSEHPLRAVRFVEVEATELPEELRDL